MSSWPADWLAASPGRVCPFCKTASGRPIVRGMPGPDLMQAISRGRLNVVLGGCCISDHDPTHQCSRCGRTFGSPSEREEAGPARP